MPMPGRARRAQYGWRAACCSGSGYYLSASTLLSLAGLTLAPETRDGSLS